MSQRVLNLNQIPSLNVVSNVSTATSNSYVNLGGMILQWFKVSSSPGGSSGPFTTNFPVPFPNACLSVNGNNNGAGPIVINSFNVNSVIWYTDFGSTAPVPAANTQYFFAEGF